MDRYDVVVVGGGFAGVTAARELRRRGYGVLILEARDRLGGRTWVSDFGGLPVEMGGTWVHWMQPHVWAEIARYGLRIVESPHAERCGWITGGRLVETSADDYYRVLNDGIARFCHDAHTVFERPFDPLFKPEAVAAIDALSIRDRLEQLDLPRDVMDLLDGEWTGVGHAPNAEAGLSVALRWFALSGWDPQLIHDTAGRYKIEQGTRGLIEAMAADGAADLRLSAPVAAVEQSADGAVVATRDGAGVAARAVVLTAPLNTWRAISFRPALAAAKQAAAAEGQASRGVKVWVRLRGERPAFFGSAPGDHPITWLGTEYALPGATVLVGFGPAADRLDIGDHDAVAAAVREFFPGAAVEAVAGHDWVVDEFSRGTWPVFRPGQLTRYLRALQQSEGRLFMAGSETANGWSGFIDGAIESGLTAARHAAAFLGATAGPA